jgi:hypothetical protein
VLADLDRAAAVGADEMHISMNLVIPVPPDQQAELLGVLAAKLGLVEEVALTSQAGASRSFPSSNADQSPPRPLT